MRRRVVPAAGATAAALKVKHFLAANRISLCRKMLEQRRRMDYFAQQLINGIVLGSI
jgi:hypothetical protein